MPSANNRRNRRMRKCQAKAQAMTQNDLPRSPLPLTVVNNSINSINCPSKSDNSRDECYVCDGKKCGSIYRVGYCGCKFGYFCFDSTYITECPTCPFKDPNAAIDTFSENVAGGMVEVGELASMALEDLARSASNFITSKSFDTSRDTFVLKSATPFDNRPRPPMDQRERDHVIRNVQIARTVAATTATVTGCIANGLGSCLWALGSALSPVVRGVSKQILSDWNVDEEKAEHMVNGGMEIAKAAIITTGSIARGIQCSTGILASGVCSRLARNYEITHGFRPGELESDVGQIAKNVVDTAWNVKAIQPKSKLTKISRIHPSHESKSSNVRIMQSFH